MSSSKIIWSYRESGARESPPEEGCPPPPGPSCGDQVGLHWESPTPSTSAADPVSPLADSHREAILSRRTNQLG